MKLPVFFYGRLWNARRVFWARLLVTLALLAGSFLAAVRLTWWAFYE
jgi:hypothetical protein